MKPVLSLLAAAVFLAGCSRPAPTSAAPQAPREPDSGGPAAAQAAPVEAKDFTGTWVTADDQGQEFELLIFPRGQAVSTWAKGRAGARGERGFWRTDRNRLLVFFDDGWTDMLIDENGSVLHRGFEKGADISGRWKNEAPARKLESEGFVGIWQLNKEPDGSYLYVALQSSGRAFSTIAGGTEGKWEATKEGALCVWPDGWNDLISPAQGGYQKRSWVGPAEQNATPPDLSPATRVGAANFSITP